MALQSNDLISVSNTFSENSSKSSLSVDLKWDLINKLMINGESSDLLRAVITAYKICFCRQIKRINEQQINIESCKTR